MKKSLWGVEPFSGAGMYKGKKQERTGNVWRRANSPMELKHKILNEERLLERTTLQKALGANLRIWTSSLDKESF